MTTLVDAVNPENLPVDAQAVAGYDDGAESEWPADAWDRFAEAKLKLHITVLGKVTSDVADCEKGDLTPAGAAQWAVFRRKLGFRPCIYTSRDNWAACVAELQKVGLSQGDADWWIADWANESGQGSSHLVPGSVATQWDHDLAAGYDVTELEPTWVPSAPLAPAPPEPIPAPAPVRAHQEEDMAFITKDPAPEAQGQYVVDAALTGKRPITQEADFTALLAAGYPQIELTEELFAAIPNR